MVQNGWLFGDGQGKMENDSRERSPEEAYSLEKWHGCVAALRSFLQRVGAKYKRRI
jgi:hypothetical protein